MSIKVMDTVFRYSEMTGNDRLLMLAIADNADEEHQVAWPSMSTLSRKTKIPLRTLFRCVKRCVASGELSYERGNSERSNRYTILLRKPGGSVKMTSPPVVPVPGSGVVPSPGTDVVPSSGTLTVIEPSVKPPVSTLARGSIEQIREYCLDSRLPASDGDWFFYKCEGNGWTNNGKPIRNWRATIRAWTEAGYMPSQKKTSNKSTHTVFELKSIIEAKRQMADSLKRGCSYEVATGRKWRSDADRIKYNEIVKEITDLNQRLASM